MRLFAALRRGIDPEPVAPPAPKEWTIEQRHDLLSAIATSVLNRHQGHPERVMKPGDWKQSMSDLNHTLSATPEGIETSLLVWRNRYSLHGRF